MNVPSCAECEHVVPVMQSVGEARLICGKTNRKIGHIQPPPKWCWRGEAMTGWRLRLEFKPQDCWIGVFWKRDNVWICLVPMLPIHVFREVKP